MPDLANDANDGSATGADGADDANDAEPSSSVEERAAAELERTEPGDAPEPDRNGGVRIDLISRERMEGLASMEKIRLILDGVHEGNIVVLERGLSPEEESKLIEVTMNEIDQDEFTGIEIESYPGDRDETLFDRLMGRENQKLTVIGPANRIETLHKDESLISTLVSG